MNSAPLTPANQIGTGAFSHELEREFISEGVVYAYWMPSAKKGNPPILVTFRRDPEAMASEAQEFERKTGFSLSDALEQGNPSTSQPVPAPAPEITSSPVPAVNLTGSLANG